MKTIFQITYNSDRMEGRGYTINTNIFFEKYTDAIKFVKSKEYGRKFGIMNLPGSKYNIIEVNKADIIPKIYKSIEDYQKKENIQINDSPEKIKRDKYNNMDKKELIEILMKKSN